MNPILAAYASKGSSSVAEKMVQDMTTGRQGAPDSKSFELLAQVLCLLIVATFFYQCKHIACSMHRSIQ